MKGGAILFAGFGPLALYSGKPAHAGADHLDRAYFEALRGQWLHVDAAGWKDVELIDVGGSSAAPLLDQFTVTFRGSPHAAFEEGMYEVAPADGNSFQLHLQPAGKDGQAPLYLASFAIIKPLLPACGGAA